MLNRFEAYLIKTEYSETTISGYCRIVEKFLNWCKRNSIELESLDYDTWMKYHRRIKNKTTRKRLKLKDNSVKQHIGILRLFFNFLILEDVLTVNPIGETEYKDNSKFFHNALSKDELEDLYHRFPTENLSHPKCPSAAIRNKVILGLSIFQGIDCTTLKRMKVSNIDLNRGEIYIPSTRRSNSRTLNLDARQMIVLMQYLENHRPILQKKIKCYTEALFPLNTPRFSIITGDISKKLRRLNLRVTNLKQIRHSVIKCWTKELDLRKVQIMAGHRYISSTQKYIDDNKKKLYEATKRCHPMCQ